MQRFPGCYKIILFFSTARLTQYYAELFRDPKLGVANDGSGKENNSDVGEEGVRSDVGTANSAANGTSNGATNDTTSGIALATAKDTINDTIADISSLPDKRTVGTNTNLRTTSPTPSPNTSCQFSDKLKPAFAFRHCCYRH